jgi:hypothetical protein
MKLSHKINHNYTPDHTDPEWADRVEREAERHTQSAERAFTKAKARLDQALLRAEHEQARKKPDRKKVKSLWAAVENRRQELIVLEATMRQSPGGHQKHRPVPGMGTL